MKKFILLLLLLLSTLAYSQTTPGEYTIDNAKINTKYSDFGTSYFGKDKVVFASPKDNTVLTKKTWSGNDQPFLDLYIGTINDKGQIINKKRIIGDVNNRYHEGIVAFTKDLKTVYFSANNYTEKHKAKKDSTGMVNIQLYKAIVTNNGEWHNIVKLPFNSDEFSTGHPALNKDDTKLYFVSDRSGSFGKTDIFVVDVNTDGTYGEPKNLGNKINTVEREMFPYISGDNILYFSSNGHSGYGDLDVFASKIFDNTVSEPINLEDPVNSVKDDFAFIIRDSIHKGYFSSNRENGKGDDDIYSFTSFPPIRIEGKQIISGLIFDKETLELVPNAVVILQDEEGNELARKDVSIHQTQNNTFLSVINNQNTTIESGKASAIKIKKTVDNPNPKIGEEVEITVDVTNEGSAVAKGIKVSDVLPEGLTYISDDGTGSYKIAKDIIELAEVENGETKTIKIRAKVKRDFSNTNLIDQRITTTSGKASVIEIQKNVDNPSPKVGEEVEITVDVTNIGSTTAKGVKISDILPEGLIYVSDDGTDKYKQSADIIELAKVKKGEKVTVKIKARVTKDFNDPITEGNAFSFDVKSDTNYKIIVEAPGFLREETEFKTTNDTDIDPVKISVKLAPELRVDNDKIMVNINTIYFDFDKWNIRPDAAKELDKVIGVMKDHPSIKIEAGSHTDSRAREAYNQRLSERRAKSTKDYIIAGGIDPSRIVSKGYGEMQLVNGCSSFVKCTREEHQQNRRTEFVIVNDNNRFSASSKQQQEVPLENTTVNSSEDKELDSLSKVTKFIKFKPMYYEFDNWSLSNDELKQIDQVIQTMNEYPKLVVQVNVHTDAKNLESYNQKFSDKRAKSIVDYMISKGVDSHRISGKGFGEMVLANHCSSFVKCGEEKQQANRRVEFMVVAGNGYPATEEIMRYGTDIYINHNPIYFDFDRYVIRKDAAYELDRIVKIMKNNPNLIIVAESHTDSQNLESYNQLLSEKRAKSTKKYLVSKGVSPSRITTKGFGEKRLTNHCSSFVKCTPEEHQVNRRTEFKIIKK